jgi:hypothetical protein
MGDFKVQHLGMDDEILGEFRTTEEEVIAEMYGLIEESYRRLVAYIQAEGPHGFRAIRRNPCFVG